jgi:hypothetical protein
MDDARWFDGDELEAIRLPRLDYAGAPTEPPSVELDSGPFRRLCISAEWAKFVVGALTRLLRPDAWEGSESDVEVAMLTIERMIAQLAVPYDVCTDEVDIAQPPPELVYVGGGTIEDSDMGQVVTEVFLDEDTGELVVRYGKCCERRWTLDDWRQAEGAAPSTPDGTVTSPTDPPATDVACQKAYYMANLTVEILQAAWEEFPDTIYGFAAGLRDSYGRFDLSNWSIYKLYQELTLVWAAELLFLDVWKETDTQRLACLWYPLLNGDDYSFSRSEYDAISSAKRNVGNPVMEGLLAEVFEMLNFSSYQMMAAEAQSVDTYDCTCPGETSTGYEQPLQFNSVFDITGDGAVTYDVLDNGRVIDVSWDAPSGDNVQVNFRIDMKDLSPENYPASFTLKYTPLDADYQDLPLNYWTIAGADCGSKHPSGWADFDAGPSANWAAPDETFIGRTRYDSWSETSPADIQQFEVEARNCPETGAPARVFNFRVEIVEVDGISYG